MIAGESGSIIDTWRGCVKRIQGSQAAAITESPIANGCHAVADGQLGQAAATIESIVANGCHTVADSHLCQAAATIVFASN